MRILSLLLLPAFCAWAAAPVVTDPKAAPRELFGASRLREAAAGARAPAGARIVAGTADSGVLARYKLPGFAPGEEQAFRLQRAGNDWLVIGSDPSGVLYGELELARLIRASGRLPETLDLADRPSFVLRGPCIGMQKTEITYDGAIYDYRYTPEDFPFFYDRQHWLRYLDMLLENRMNTLYLWNGHPFTSLLKLPRYPEAQELTDEQLERNIEMFRWLTAEADKRGIWVIQFFYNIHISHALARARNVPFHHSTPTRLTSDYTRYAISEFIKNYPNVGLLMTLGEALAPRHGAEWLAGTIIPGVKDGMAALGLTKEPPIIVRAHATEIENAMKQALPLYRNIYTMHKYNGESLTWTDVRGPVEAKHKYLVSLGSTHIVNVHLLANLEPFRWGSPDFIQKSMQSCRRLGIKGLHLYPLRYWEWPVTADHPPVQQIDRDWIWFEAWARYAWNPDRDRAAEREYWIGRLAEKYGSREAGRRLLEAYESWGVSAPRMLPRVGITEGNRQAFALGMLMVQLINPARFNAFPYLWLGGAPEGERLEEWVEREWSGKPHIGETPIGVAEEVVASAHGAVKSAEAAGPHVTKNREEYLRLLNDTRAIAALMRHYRAKTNAAALVLRYGYSKDLGDLRKALRRLAESVEEYRALLALTDKTYRQACSIHGPSRRIPFLGRPGRYTHWRDVLPEFERELATFRRNLGRLESGSSRRQETAPAALPGVPVTLVSGQAETFTVRPGEKLYTAGDYVIQDVAPELRGLTGIRISQQEATRAGDGVRIQFELPAPAHILVGFFRSSKKGAAAAPPRDEWEPVYRNAVVAAGHPALTVYSHALPAGRNELDCGRGAYVVLGFARRDAQLNPRMVFFSEPGTNVRADLDWLFE